MTKTMTATTKKFEGEFDWYNPLRMTAGNNYLELFARQTKAGWDNWGNETSKFGQTS